MAHGGVLAVNGQGESALHKAALSGSLHTASALLLGGAAVHQRTCKGETALHYAVRAGRADLVHLLLQHGADPHVAGAQGTAAQVAVAEARTQAAELLHSAAANAAHCGSPDAPALCDRYGFPVDAEALRRSAAAHHSSHAHARDHRSAWSKYLRQARHLEEDMASGEAALRRLVRRGIPYENRGELWHRIAQIRKGSVLGSQYYAGLLAQDSFAAAKEVDKDVTRTFPSHGFFASESGRASLRNVLLAYSVRNPALGYCQSMNFLVGLLLLVMSEEHAFWVLCYVVEDLLEDYYAKSMTGLSVDQRVLEALVARKMPRVAQRLQELHVPLSVVATRWHMCIFINSLPTETTMRVWDCFLLEGAQVLLLVSFALVKGCEAALENARGGTEVMEVLHRATADAYDADALLRTAFKYSGLFGENELFDMRQRLWSAVEEERAAKRRQLANLQRSRAYFPATCTEEDGGEAEAGELRRAEEAQQQLLGELAGALP